LTGVAAGAEERRALDIHLSLISMQFETVRKTFVEIGDAGGARDVAEIVAHAKRQLQRLRTGN
jgi:hypothetical protein